MIAEIGVTQMNDENKPKEQLIDDLARLRQENVDLNETELRKSERELSILMGNLPGMVYYCLNDQDWTMKFVSEGSLDLTGYLPDELSNNKVIAYNDLIHPDDRKIVFDAVQDALAKKNAYLLEYRIITKNHAVKYVWEQGQGIFTPDGELHRLQGFIMDITALKQAEAALIQQVASQDILLKISRHFTSSVADNVDDMINVALKELGIFNDADRCYVVLFSEDGAKVKATHEWCAEGIPPSIYVLQNKPLDLFPWTLKKLQRHEAVYVSSIKDLPLEAQPEKELMHLKGTQSLLLVPIYYEDSPVGFLGFDSISGKIVWSEESITILNLVAQIFANALQRKQYIATIRESENYYRTIFEHTGATTMISEEDLTITMVNEECQRLLGYAKEDLIGKKWTDFIAADMVEPMKEYHRMRRIDPAAVPLTYQMRMIDREGKYKDGLLAVDMIPGTNKSVATFIDFTEFNRIDRALKAISAVNIAMIQAEKEEDLLQNVCQKIVEVGGYNLVGVVYLQADQQQTVKLAAYAGTNHGYVAQLNITLQDPQRGQGPTATAIRTGQPVVSRDFEKNDTIKPWLEDALRQGFKSSMSIPLLADNKAFGALIVYSSEIGRFDRDEEKLLNEIGNDLSYAIMSMRNRIEKIQTAEELEKSLEKMKRILLQEVSSLGTALNAKDPYTAGHQKKVVRLATAIAEEIGLSKDQIEGLAVAGNLHDIGKICVPSEILNKPGKLTDIEFAMIKTHSQAGYEIVKDIEFPWPVAEVILQTHERMNGSGYPRGLTGEDILVEARIMAVADVVEAMASHRPYRPALGIDAALEEIVQNRGILYDPEVVDACLKLFREKKFKLE
jgi:PAS domain S-box-containing protein